VDVIPIILDRRPDYLRHAPPACSLLSLPVGTGTVLSELVSCLPPAGTKHVHILPTFSACAAYTHTILEFAPPGAKVVGPDVLTTLVHEREPSDLLMVLDPRHWPVEGLDVGDVIHQTHGTRWAVHGVAIGSSGDNTKEYVHFDEQGRVRRISRYYDQVTYLKIDAIAYSVVPLASCERITFESLGEFRAALAARGVLSRDVPVSSTMVDLSQEYGLLTLNEQRAVRALTGDAPQGYTFHSSGTLAGAGCRIHPSSRIIGPVILQEGVTIEAGATILGPTVIGAGSSVRREALVAQAVLARHCTVPPDGVVRQQLGVGKMVAFGHASGEGEVSPVPVEAFQSDGVRLGADASALGQVRVRRSIYPTVKLVVDAVAAMAAIVILAPLFVLTAIAIKLDSKGPVFFGHEREGKNGRVFRCWKFRTMVQDAHVKQRELYSTNALDGPQFKIDNDPRVTRVGAWLRATNVDELPQLFNVIEGRMSLVGPRPSPFRENQICVPWRRARLSVRPGITGLWQICRDQRGEGDFHQWIAYDIMYVRHMSWWLDLKILLATIFTLGGLWSVRPNWLVSKERPTLRHRAPRTPNTGLAPAARSA